MILEASNLHKHFDYPSKHSVLKGVDIAVSPGESVAIVGRSGEGKSTLLQILGTLEPPSLGSLSIAGQEATGFNAAKLRSKHIGFIFQSFCLLEDFTVLENLLMPARILRHDISPNSLARKRAFVLLEEVGLSSHANHMAKLLSGGEKQRVAIARALCNNPEIILADEPSGNLDKDNANKIHEILLNLCTAQKKTLIVVTHDQELATLCQTRYRLESGKLNLTNS